MYKSPFIVTPISPDAKKRLICLPFAGGDVSFFSQWPALLPRDVDLVPMQLAGRGRRIDQQSHTSIPDLAAELSVALLPILDRDFVLFGHSMGALIAFEIALHLEAFYALLPRLLLVSGCKAPQAQGRSAPLSKLSNRDFLSGINRFGGIPEDALRCQELVDLALPLLRSDMRSVEQYKYSGRHLVSAPIMAFGGDSDSFVTKEDLSQWSGVTRATYELMIFRGGHFFLSDNRENFLERISSTLSAI